MKLFVCENCGNIVDSVKNSENSCICCGKRMQKINSDYIKDFLGHHAPICYVYNNNVYVAVSTMEHPMEENHYIKWIAIETEIGKQIKYLTPSDTPFVKFNISDCDNLKSAYACCSKHGMWKYDNASLNRGDSAWKCYSA